MSYLNLRSLSAFFSFVEVVDVVMYCLFFLDPYAYHQNNNTTMIIPADIKTVYQLIYKLTTPTHPHTQRKRNNFI
jgi:hypothetical protein